MSKIKISTQAELTKFLKILAEEAVTNASAAVDAKSRQDRITNDIVRGKNKFMKEEVPAAPGTEATSQTDTSQSQQQDTAANDTKPKDSADDDSHNVLEPKLGELIDAINLLRGVPSTRDSAVEEKLRAYFDGLSSAEASSLIIMVRSIASVMSGKVDPAQAKEPKDYNIRTEIDGNKAQEPQALDTQKSQQQPTTQTQQAPKSTAPPEKVEPPIKVNAPTQVTEDYRAKIKQLLKSV